MNVEVPFETLETHDMDLDKASGSEKDVENKNILNENDIVPQMCRWLLNRQMRIRKQKRNRKKRIRKKIRRNPGSMRNAKFF